MSLTSVCASAPVKFLGLGTSVSEAGKRFLYEIGTGDFVVGRSMEWISDTHWILFAVWE